MKLAIVHHHLNPGGVTRVISSHLHAVRRIAPELQLTNVLVLHGGRGQEWSEAGRTEDGMEIEVVGLPALDYDPRETLDIDTLVNELTVAFTKHGFGIDDTIIHVHNHSLGKHVSLPGALRYLADQGYRLLLQIHDFAEDLRPNNYQKFCRALGTHNAGAIGRYVYPVGKRIHYAVLNSRDYGVLLRSKMEVERVHLLPNPVTGPESLPPSEDALARFRKAHGLDRQRRVVLYPVRAIRRKNLGELLLWSAVAGGRFLFAVSLPATSDLEVPSFTRWCALARRLDLPFFPNVGLHPEIPFEVNIAAADRIITTSVAEGFGLTFLESWLHQRPLIGRNLVEITTDFTESGIDLKHLGQAVQIPLDWVGPAEYARSILELQTQLCAAYGQELSPATKTIARQRAACRSVDFADLPTRQQVRVLERIVANPDSARIVFDENPWMAESLSDDGMNWKALIESNASVVRREFSLEGTARRLQSIYSALSNSSQGEIGCVPEPSAILDAFLDIERLRPVRVEP